ncbi:MAG TPA: hypothetical protein DCR07_06460 [Lactococcus sp.]|nr:hypothetical protein [Lactococcus sp.]
MKEHYKMTFFLLTMFEILILALQFMKILTGVFNFIVTILVGLLIPSVYFTINCLIEEDEDKVAAVHSFINCCTLLPILIINGILFVAFPIKDKLWPLALSGAVDFFCFICLSFAVGQPLTKAHLEEIKDVNLLYKLGINLFTPEKKPGDIVLCKNADTGQDVIIPSKDRFLHMLILGPTGSGKTSQIILPMLNQDLQNHEIGVTVIEPKGDLAEKAYAMAQYYGRPAVYFNPIAESCPTFNPLFGKEEDVIENMVTAFNMLNPDSQQYFKDMNEQLLRNALKVLKRLNGDKATLIDLSRLISNSMGAGRTMVMSFAKKSAQGGISEALKKENDDVANYFLGDYFNEKSKTYENTSGVRSQIAKIVSNKFLRRVLNPENGECDINFDKHLEDGTVICISTAQGKLQDLGKYLGFFIILNFQSSVFKRPGRENDRRHHMLYIDEFQTYANPGFANMLTQGRSYRVASHLATQNRALIGMGSGKDGDDFIELVSTNARNTVLFPGGNYMDAKYYSDQFGEVMQRDFQVGVSRTKFNPLYLEGGKAPTESNRMSEKLGARYTPTDIILKKKKEITYSIIVDGVLKPAGVGKVEYIDKDLNERLDKMIEENDILMTVGLNPNKWRDLEHGAVLKRNLNWKKVLEDYNEIITKERYDYVEETAQPEEQPTQSTQTPPTGPAVNFIPDDTPPRPPTSSGPKSPLPPKVAVEGTVIDTKPPKPEVNNDDGDDLI